MHNYSAVLKDESFQQKDTMEMFIALDCPNCLIESKASQGPKTPQTKEAQLQKNGSIGSIQQRKGAEGRKGISKRSKESRKDMQELKTFPMNNKLNK